jgi:outer membrane usher protein
MRRDDAPTIAIRTAIVAGLLLAALPSGLVRTAEASERQRAVLSLVVNGIDMGQILVLVDGPEVWADVQALEGSGLQGFDGRREEVGDRLFVALSTLAPRLGYALDPSTVSLRLTAEASLFGSVERHLVNGRPGEIQYRSDTSAFLNYAIHAQPGAEFDAATELGVSVRGALFQTTLSRLASGSLVRGESNLIIDDRRHLSRWIVGDSLASAGVLGGAASVSGVTVARDFDLDPYVVRHPTLGFTSALTTPSTIEIYLNDVLVDRQDLPPGNVSLDGLAVPRGLGEARVVIRDAFGREQQFSSPYYMTTSLLGQGLHEYRYTVGALRRRADVRSFSYGTAVFMGTHRYGLTDRLTIGLQGEASKTLWNGGPSIGVQLGRLGEADVAWSASRRDGRSGMGIHGAYSFSAPAFSVGVFARSLSDDYAAIGLDEEVNRQPQLDAGATLGLRTGPRTTASFEHVIVTRSHGAAGRRGSREQRSSVFLQSQVTRRAALFGLASHTWDGGNRRTEVVFGLNVSIGGTTSGALSVRADSGEVRPSVDVLKSLPRGNGVGYRVHASDPAAEPALAALQYQGPYGRYEVEQRAARGQQATVVGLSGSLVAVGGSVFAARPVEQSFAVIHVPGVGGVRGYSSNQEIGTTNRRGDLLVTDLLPYYGNLLGIADGDIPLNYRIDGTRQVVAPPYRGGAVVDFPVRAISIVTGSVVLRQIDRTIEAAHGDLVVMAGGRRFESPLGWQGEFYLEDLPAGTHEAVVEDGVPVCRFTLIVPEATDSVVRLGRLVCLPGRESP